jgi:thiol:disulfide interchange protein DsbC
MKYYTLTTLLILATLSPSVHSSGADRWYNTNQVKQGEKLFAANCASCHGNNAQATPEWRKRDVNGNLVPPPLNGTAHTWHHPMKILRHTVRKGGAPVGGTMPAFEDKLSATEIDAIISWFQSKWSDEIYAAWHQRNNDTGFQPVKPKTSASNPLTQLLRQRLRGVEVGEPEETGVNGLYQAKVGADYAYLFEQGRYALVGDLIDLKTGKNITELAKGKDKLNLLLSFPETDMVIFPANGSTEQTITILTDTDCPFCRKLHKEVPQLQKADIKVRYIAFPRGGKLGSGYAGLKSVWCAKDRNAAMDIAKGIVPGELSTKDCDAAAAVDRGYELGVKVGLRGTPAIILENGLMLEGYMPANKLITLSRSNIK